MKAKILKLKLKNSNLEISRESLQNVYKNEHSVAIVSPEHIIYYYSDGSAFIVSSISSTYVTSKFRKISSFRQFPRWFFKIHVQEVIYE